MRESSSRNLICLLSMPRSGSSWIGKILDSHPNTRYLHEPDSDLTPLSSMKQFEEIELEDAVLSEATIWGRNLRSWRSERSTLSLPQFPKSYRSSFQDRYFRSLVYACKLFYKIGVKVPIPTDVRAKEGGIPIDVIKSISLLPRVRYVIEIYPQAKILHLLRHPCGYVASRLSGEKLGVMSGSTYLEALANTPWCNGNGLTIKSLEAMSKEEQFAVRWVATNDYALHFLKNAPVARTVVYDAFCIDPIENTKSIFGWCGLGVPSSTMSFIFESTDVRLGTSSRYYSVKKNSLEASTKWKSTLSSAQIERVLAIVSDTRPGKVVAASMGLSSL